MLTDFRKYIAHHSLIGQGEKILLAVSGGVDSMVMLDLFLRAGYDVEVAHCNFSLRGAESDSDQALAEDTARRNNAPLHTIRFDTKQEAADHGESIQMAARRLRYTWFEELCTEYRFDKIAIAHHANDSAETFFINLMRGTGLRGLTGISVASGRVIRPLMFATSDRITDYAAEHGIRFHNDSSNGETKYLRNWLRHDIIPRLEDSSARFLETMSENLLRLEQAQNFIDYQVDKIREQAIRENIIDLEIVKRYGNINFVIFELLRTYGFSPDVIEEMVKSLEKSGKRFLSTHYVAVVDRQRIIIEPVERQAITEEVIDENDPRIEWVDVSELMSLETPSNVALLTVDTAQFPLTVRKWRAGDSFIPLGMSGHKLVSDYLIDTKVPVPQKDRQCVLMLGESIMWLIGRRIDDRFKVTEKSKRIIRITL